MMISMDDPEHQWRRSLVSRGFTPKRVAGHEPMVRELCRQIIDRVCEAGSCDFVWDIAAPLPLYVIADLLGYEPATYGDLLRWSEEMMSPTAADMTTPEQIAKRLEAAHRRWASGRVPVASCARARRGSPCRPRVRRPWIG
jgi:cytochrome P450 family 142 subfamily A polypeptide 1